MNKEKKISSPEKLNDYLKATSIFTWILLGIVIFCLLGIFIWSFSAKITYKIEGEARINGGILSIEIDEKRLNELSVGQVVYVGSCEGVIKSIGEDNKPIISGIDLEDGEYSYTIILKTIHPIEYLFNR